MALTGNRVVIRKNVYDTSPPFDTVFEGQTGVVVMESAPADPDKTVFIKLDSGYACEATGSATWPFVEGEYEVVGR